ncbi:MAG TPA: hypothetical protein VK034_13580 [Enhygromyxa sp.]|nr:hypothetical protein [Enhygromyxa sp.]
MERVPQRNLELEAAAFANFDDLDSWRVFADWLLSKGDSRGEIASLAAHLGEAFLSERKRMAARIAELERPYIDGWHQWAQGRDLLDVEVEFKRGFAHAIEGSLTQMQPVIDELFERDPIQRLTLTEVEPDTLARLFERDPEWLGRLRYLKLSGTIDETAAAAMAGVELPQLRRLNLLGMGMDVEVCGQLAGLRTQVLERLTLTANEIDDEGLAALLGSPTRGQWRELYLSGNPLEAGGLARLVADRELRLTGLYACDIGANLGEFAPLADRSAIPTLTHLEAPNWGSWQHQAVLEQLRERFGAGLVLR